MIIFHTFRIKVYTCENYLGVSLKLSRKIKQRGLKFSGKIKQRLSNDPKNLTFFKGLLKYSIAYKK